MEKEVDAEAMEYAKLQGITDSKFLQGRMSLETCNFLNYAKLKHRSSLKLEDWSRDGYYKRQHEVTDILLKAAIKARKKNKRVDIIERSPEGIENRFQDTIERVNYNDLSCDEFLERFEFGSKPVII